MDFFRSPDPDRGWGEVGVRGGSPYERLLVLCIAFSRALYALLLRVVGDCRYSSIFLLSSMSRS